MKLNLNKLFIAPILLLSFSTGCFNIKTIAMQKPYNQNKITNKSPTEWSVYTETTINATRHDVWNELTNFKDMPTWSKSLQSIDGIMRKDNNVVVHFMDNTGKVNIYDHKLIDYEEGKTFAWSDPFLPMLTDHHVYLLEDLPDGRTKLVQKDQANGFSALFIGKIAADFMLRTYTEFNNTIKERVEEKVKRVE